MYRNKMFMWAAGVALALGTVAGCTDASLASFSALGDEATVTCFSGGEKVFEDTSTGIVEGGPSGVYFKSKTTGRFINTYADCIVVSK